MKSTTLIGSFITALALTTTVWAGDVTVKLSGVHLCCNACVKGVEKAVSSAKGVTTVVDKEGGVVAFHGADKTTVQKGIDALVAGGYFGVSDDPSLKPQAHSGGSQGKVQSLNVEGVHLCCGKCVKAVNDAVTKVKGVKATTAEKNAPSFAITGDFQAKDVYAALEKAGFSAKAGK